MIITIIEENRVLSNILHTNVIKNWYNTKIIGNCADFLNDIYINSDLFIIWSFDIENHGNEIIKYIRKNSFTNSPIIVIWCQNDSKKIVNILNIWADDYLNTPYCCNELLARIRALIRRSYKITYNSKLIYKNIIYYSTEKVLRKKWINIKLTSRELQLAEFILSNIWKLITKEQLINSVWWEYDLSNITDNNINVTISNLRKKLWENFKLKTLVNRWYILEK